MRESLALVDLISLDRDPGWWFYGDSLILGSIPAIAWTARPMRLCFGEQRQLMVFIGYGGEQRVRQGSRTWRCRSDSCLLMASTTCSLESSLSSAVAFPLSHERLLHTAMSMGGLNHKPGGWNQHLEQAHGWSLPGDPAAPSLQAALRQVIATAGQLSSYGNGLLERLQLDDQIYRLLAAMLLPELREEKTLDRLLHRQRQGRDAFDELIDYIRQNLGEPLNLTLLESRSHYSRRALQYAFVERMGCTATQWIRKQRLDKAREHLEKPRPTDTVGSISRECGYRSLGLFSVDFQQRFHVKPSQLLRESRTSIFGALPAASIAPPEE
ncbi:helix-turn-helix domain-containing protein [Synechococcus sp. CCY 9618]|uniref:helix-turn-helix domain-containing protein n=1 Tax=Synechococcus sp. CCY 9618 TaxID=2815602 RepID=UPI001C22493C|nr:AraC family transcriptional regulator [Synechococcus sp. CCY 9618]